MKSRSMFLTTSFFLATMACSASAFAAEGVAIHSGTLRAGPGNSYPVVAAVSTGEDLTIFGCLNGYSWCDVSADGDRGWLSGARIEFLRSGARVSLSDNYDSFGLVFITFGLTDYWGRYYDNRPWFGDHRWRRGHDALPSDWKQTHDAGNHPNPTPGTLPHATVKSVHPSEQAKAFTAPKPTHSTSKNTPYDTGNSRTHTKAPGPGPGHVNRPMDHAPSHMNEQQQHQNQNAPHKTCQLPDKC